MKRATFARRPTMPKQAKHLDTTVKLKNFWKEAINEMEKSSAPSDL